MKGKITTHAFPLVILVFGVSAHAGIPPRTVAASRNGASLNVKDTVEEVKDESSGAESVVQDWNLVCEQLCRAGLGGPPCGPQCDNITETYTDRLSEAANYLLQDNRDDICNILCSIDLGQTSCTCMVRSRIPAERLERDTVCKTFCERGKVALPGCSPCTHQSVINDSSGGTPSENSKVQTASQTQPQSGKTMESLALNSTPSTTPDWNEYCLTLCKIGEGGSLCNCDLPPFF
ncbi:uncharacterized protein LOC119650352 [Hermetia illucens]|nr:uncharacterized protein LOC119650352 [Hermetia illucens]